MKLPLRSSVMAATSSISLALESLCVVVEALAKLPNSKERAAVLDGVRGCNHAVERWSRHPPTAEENERVTTRIASLHAAAVRLLGG